jgi:hypothetical protein
MLVANYFPKMMALAAKYVDQPATPAQQGQVNLMD